MRGAASSLWIVSGAVLGVGLLLFLIGFWAADTVRAQVKG